jgi:hypothetical protein
MEKKKGEKGSGEKKEKQVPEVVQSDKFITQEKKEADKAAEKAEKAAGGKK